MIQIAITKDTVARAEAEAADMGGVHNSILSGRGNLAGFVGELVVADLTGATRQNTKDYDLITPDGLTIDVKTKRTKFKPEDDFEASIAKTSLHQGCSIYCFVRVLYNLSWAYVCGFYPKERYFEDATYLKKGDYDPSNDFVVKWSCYNLPHHRLMTWEEAKGWFELGRV